MILHELRELALREGLVEDPTFESKPVVWIIRLDEDGEYLGLSDTCVDIPLPEGKKGKPKRQAAMMAIPRRNGRRSNDAADFLVDKSEYVLGIEPEGKRSAEDLKSRRSLFVSLLAEASLASNSATGNAATAFLSNDSASKACISEIEERGYQSNDLITIRVDNELLHEDDALRAWWAARVPPVKRKTKGLERQCVICGNFRASVEIHDTLRLPGGAAGGTPLVAFNEHAFEKYGLERNDNAPVCRECMTAYVEGLRRLINARYVSSHTGEVVVPQNTRLSGNTTAVYWANIQDPILGVLGGLMYSPQQVKGLLDSPHRGLRSRGTEGRFFCLILSGAQGRAMLRTMHTGTLDELEISLTRYFDSIQLEGRDPGRPEPLVGLLRSLVLQGKLDRLPPRLAGEIFLGVLFGIPMPKLVLAAAVARNRAEQKVLAERAALIQLYFTSRKTEVPTVSLNAQSTLPAYRLGRLLAVFEKTQTDAQGGNLNRTIVDRSFGAASTRPGVVFPQLVRLSQTHLSKLGKKGDYLNKWIDEITDGLDSFAPMLSLEEQGQFALGYYHQRQALWRKRDKSGNNPDQTQDNQAEGATAE